MTLPQGHKSSNTLPRVDNLNDFKCANNNKFSCYEAVKPPFIEAQKYPSGSHKYENEAAVMHLYFCICSLTGFHNVANSATNKHHNQPSRFIETPNEQWLQVGSVPSSGLAAVSIAEVLTNTRFLRFCNVVNSFWETIVDSGLDEFSCDVDIQQ